MPVITQAYTSYPTHPPQMSSSLSQLGLPPIFNVGVCCIVCFLLSGSDVADVSNSGAQTMGFASLQPIGAYFWQTYSPPAAGLWPVPGVHLVAAPQCFE